MNRSSRNQEVIVFLCRNLVDILFCVEHQFAFLCLTQIVDHRFFINARFHSQINYGIFFRIYHVVTFILCIVHTETITDKLSGRMHLQTQITSAHRIQKVETNREVFSKACLHRFTKQLFTFQQNQIDRRKFEAHSVHLKIEAVFFGHTVKAPAEIFAFTIQIANLFHPLTTPGSRIEERNYPERCVHRCLYPFKESILINHLRCPGHMGVNPEFYPVKQSFLIPITYSPIVEIPSLVLQRNSIVPIVYT
jgi:hypothetical protein